MARKVAKRTMGVQDDNYGSEAIIPAQVGLTSYKVENHDENRNDEAISLQLDLVDEVRATAE